MSVVHTYDDSVPAQMREQARDRLDEVLSRLIIPDACAVAVVGSYARGEHTEYSDVDIILLRPEAENPAREKELEALLYELWASNVRIDHAVRTPHMCAAMISENPIAALGLLDITHAAGDAALVDKARREVLDTWRRELPRHCDEVMNTAVARWRRSGSLVTMTRPDIKHGRGGLRDAELAYALGLGHVADTPDLAYERRFLSDVRVLLHHYSRRQREILEPEYATDIAHAVGYADRYALGRAVARAGQEVSRVLTESTTMARNMLTPLYTHPAQRYPLDVDVFERRGDVVLARDAALDDPALPLRVAAAAIRHDLPVAADTWTRLEQYAATHEVPDMVVPWPKSAVADFFTILSSPHRSAAMVRELDAHHLWTRYVPEWDLIRGMIPREPSHLHTVDTHSLLTVQECAAEVVKVTRPDLLLLCALYHDVGKGLPGPHAVEGARCVVHACRRLGLTGADMRRVRSVVLEHTTLARVGATRDVQNADTLSELLDACNYDVLVLEILSVLTPADARSTGPYSWPRSLSWAVHQLVDAARFSLTCHVPLPPQLPPLPSEGVGDCKTQGICMQSLGGDASRLWWSDTDVEGLARVCALCAMKGWTISTADLCREGNRVRGVLDVRRGVWGDAASADDSEAEHRAFILAYMSDMVIEPPQVVPATVATYWYGDTVEIRTRDRVGIIPALLRTIPFDWVHCATPGATMVAHVRCASTLRSSGESIGVDKVALEHTLEAVFGGAVWSDENM